jgi:hypothetical protein
MSDSLWGELYSIGLALRYRIDQHHARYEAHGIGKKEFKRKRYLDELS